MIRLAVLSTRKRHGSSLQALPRLLLRVVLLSHFALIVATEISDTKVTNTPHPLTLTLKNPNKIKVFIQGEAKWVIWVTLTLSDGSPYNLFSFNVFRPIGEGVRHIYYFYRKWKIRYIEPGPVTFSFLILASLPRTLSPRVTDLGSTIPAQSHRSTFETTNLLPELMR